MSALLICFFGRRLSGYEMDKIRSLIEFFVQSLTEKNKSFLRFSEKICVLI